MCLFQIQWLRGRGSWPWSFDWNSNSSKCFHPIRELSTFQSVSDFEHSESVSAYQNLSEIYNEPENEIKNICNIHVAHSSAMPVWLVGWIFSVQGTLPGSPLPGSHGAQGPWGKLWLSSQAGMAGHGKVLPPYILNYVAYICAGCQVPCIRQRQTGLSHTFVPMLKEKTTQIQQHALAGLVGCLVHCTRRDKMACTLEKIKGGNSPHTLKYSGRSCRLPTALSCEDTLKESGRPSKGEWGEESTPSHIFLLIPVTLPPMMHHGIRDNSYKWYNYRSDSGICFYKRIVCMFV